MKPLLLLALTLVSASAATLGRDDAILTALANNGELSIASLEIDRAQSQLRWAGRLENPEFEISSSTDQLGRNEGEGSVEIAFTQKFPITSKLRNEKAIRIYDLELAQIEFRLRQRQLAYEVDKAWIALRAARRAQQLQSKLLKLNEEIRTFLEEQAKIGEASSLEVAQATLESSLIKQKLARSQATTAQAAAHLRILAGIPPEKPITLNHDSPLPASAPPLTLNLESALKNRPDHAALLLGNTLSQAELQLALAQRWDDISVKIFAERERSTDDPGGLERNSLIGIGISIPLPLHQRNEAAIENAQIDIEKSLRERQAKAFTIHSQLHHALQSRHSAYNLAKSAQTGSLPLARQNFEAIRKAQTNGQATPLQVKRAQAQLLELESSALESRNAYENNDAEVRFLSGTYPIPKSK